MHTSRNIGALVAAGAILGSAAIGSAQTVIGNFETAALDGWGTDGGAGSPTLSQGTTGVTLGSFSLDSVNAQSAYWGPTTGNLVGDMAAFANSTKLSYDLTLNAQNINGGAFSGYAQDNALSIQIYSPTANAGGVLNLWIQANWSANDTDSSGQNATWGGVDGTRHLTWNLADFTATDPNTNSTKTVAQFLQTYGSQITDLKIDFVQQVGGGTQASDTFFFDNVVLNGSAAPEPVSCTLLGLGALALIRRRARR